MADINITVSESQGTITLDIWEWTGLVINGVTAPKYSGNPNIQFQLTEGLTIHFTATATQDIDLVNPGNTMFLKGPNGDTYLCVISYQEKSGVITLNGSIIHLPYSIDNPQAGPILFSQGRMTGTFQLAS